MCFECLLYFKLEVSDVLLQLLCPLVARLRNAQHQHN